MKTQITFSQLKKLVKEGSSVNEMFGPPWYTDPPEPDWGSIADKIYERVKKLDNEAREPLADLVENAYDEETKSYSALKEEDRATALKYIDMMLDDKTGLPDLVSRADELPSEFNAGEWMDGIDELMGTLKKLKADIAQPMSNEILVGLFDITEGAPRCEDDCPYPDDDDYWVEESDEAPEATKVTYEDFKEFFYDEVYQEGLLDSSWSDVAEVLRDKAGLSNGWRGYNDRPENMFVLNVKYKGQGDWDKFNKDGRAEKIDYDEHDYYELLQMNIRVFYEDWDSRFKQEFHEELFAAGRSGGYWGIKADFVKHEDPGILIIDDTTLKPFYDQLLPTVEFDPDASSDDWIYDMVEAAKDKLAGRLGWVDAVALAQYFKFTPAFVKTCGEFEQSVDRQSAEYATQEFNDQEFANIAGDEFEVSEGLGFGGMDTKCTDHGMPGFGKRSGIRGACKSMRDYVSKDGDKKPMKETRGRFHSNFVPKTEHELAQKILVAAQNNGCQVNIKSDNSVSVQDRKHESDCDLLWDICQQAGVSKDDFYNIIVKKSTPTSFIIAVDDETLVWLHKVEIDNLFE